MPKNAMYVGRPTKWGNPFKAGKYLNAWGKAFIAIQLGKTPDGVRAIYKTGVFKHKITPEESMKYYRMWIEFRIERGKLNIDELKGKDLACFCSLSQPCHADVLIELATY